MNGPYHDRVVREAVRAVSSSARQPARLARAVTGYVDALRYPDLADRSAPPERSARRPAHPAVVVGVDGSAPSVVALDHAVVEADLRGWDIRLVHVQPSGPHRGDRASGEVLLAHLLDRTHARSPRVAAVSRLCAGSVGPTLVRESITAGLLVVGCSQGRIAAVPSGAVAEYVAAHRRGPVLVVRSPAWPPTSEMPARPVVAGVDGSPGSRAAVAFAAEEARLRGCELVLLHATHDRSTHPPDDPLDTVAEGDVAGLTVHRKTVHRRAAHALLAASYEASALVVGRCGRSDPATPLLGPVTRSLIYGAHCPVFVVH